MADDGDRMSEASDEGDNQNSENEDSDEEANMIPDEKPDEAMAAAGSTTLLQEQSAMDLDLLN